MESKNLESIVTNVTKLAANVTEPKKEERKPRDINDSSNRTNQNVHISLGDVDKKPLMRPIEKHVQKFPEQRALSTQECDMALKQATMDHEVYIRQQNIDQDRWNKEWEHKLEVERKNERKSKIKRAVACVLGTLGIGYIGYSIYSDYRNNKAGTMAQTSGTVSQASGTAFQKGNIAVEGTVK